MGNRIFQERIRALRHEKGLTMEELAKAIGATKSRINMWENSGAVPRNETLKILSGYFEVSVDYLLGNDSMEGMAPENERLRTLQRNLEKLDNKRLQRAENVLKAVFEDIFDDDEDHGNI